MDKTLGVWERCSIAGHQVDVRIPDAAPPHAFVLFLHSFDGTTFEGHRTFEEAFERENMLVVCPQGGQSWWLDKLCPDFDEQFTPVDFLLNKLIPWVGSRYGLTDQPAALLGIGMGGQGVINLAYRHARRFPTVAAISPDIDFHQWYGRGTPLDRMFTSPEQARQQTAILHLHPLDWPRRQLLVCDPADQACFEGTERLISKLYSSGIPYESDLETTRGGHTWDYFDAVAEGVVAFLSGGEYRSHR